MTRNNRRRRPRGYNGNDMHYDEVIRDMANNNPAWRRASHTPPILSGQAAAHNESLERDRAAVRAAGVNLNSPTQWWLLLGDNRVLMPFNIMSPEMLYREIDAAITGVVPLFQLHAEGTWLYAVNAPIGLTAKRWLAVQPAFRALVQEAIRKQVALSDIAYLFTKQYLISADYQVGNVSRPQPWADAARLASQSDLKEFSDYSVVVATEEAMVDKFGRKSRVIHLDDNDD
jgi:hypothetical protein